eukprot:960880-Pyramimonas_sp.AAC.1
MSRPGSIELGWTHLLKKLRRSSPRQTPRNLLSLFGPRPRPRRSRLPRPPSSATSNSRLSSLRRPQLPSSLRCRRRLKQRRKGKRLSSDPHSMAAGPPAQPAGTQGQRPPVAKPPGAKYQA